MGVARIFQRGGHTDSYIGYSPNCHLNIVGCLLTKRLTKGGSRAPQDPPWLRPWVGRYGPIRNRKTEQKPPKTAKPQESSSKTETEKPSLAKLW